ncbi:MAG: hypothetical protein MSH60_05410 [Ruminococcus sp.]|nr:hypothetical protein [Ruminococcus sp.]
MKIDLGDIPKGKTWRDYPKDTLFVFSESPPIKVDPKTGYIIRDNENNNSNSDNHNLNNQT